MFALKDNSVIHGSMHNYHQNHDEHGQLKILSKNSGEIQLFILMVTIIMKLLTLVDFN